MTPTADQTQEALARREAAAKNVKKVLALPSGSPERWRAAFEHFLIQRPEARAEAQAIAEAVKERKKELNKFASSKYSRHTMSTPSYLMDVIRTLDPDYFMGKSGLELTQEKHLRKMQKAFPDYFMPEVI